MNLARTIRAALAAALLSCPAIDASAAASDLRAGGASAAEASEMGRIADQVEHAAQLLFTPGRSEHQVEAGLRSLVEAIAKAGAEAGMEGAFAEKIAEALRQLSSGRFTEETATLLKECYSLVHDGKPFRMAEGVSTIQQIEEKIRRLLDSARDLLRQGKAGKSLRPLVESVVMIITPVHAGEWEGPE